MALLWKLSWHYFGDLAALTCTSPDHRLELVKKLKRKVEDDSADLLGLVSNSNNGEPALLKSIRELEPILDRAGTPCAWWSSGQHPDIAVKVGKFPAQWDMEEIFITPTTIYVPWPFLKGLSDGDALADLAPAGFLEQVFDTSEYNAQKHLRIDQCLRVIDDVLIGGDGPVGVYKQQLEQPGLSNEDCHQVLKDFAEASSEYSELVLPQSQHLKFELEPTMDSTLTHVKSDGAKLTIVIGLKYRANMYGSRSQRMNRPGSLSMSKYPTGCWNLGS